MNDKPIPFFKRFVIQNFPFIEEDFDALTNYQLFCKVVEYLNKVIGSQNEVTEQMEYVLNYFNTLDVQDEINNKLDEMAEDGTLASLISTHILGDLSTLHTTDKSSIVAAVNEVCDETTTNTTGIQALNTFNEYTNEPLRYSKLDISSIVPQLDFNLYRKIDGSVTSDFNYDKYYATSSQYLLYVNRSTGNDSAGDGSSASPFKTIKKALEAANAGSESTYRIICQTYRFYRDEFTSSTTGEYTEVTKNIIIEPDDLSKTIVVGADQASLSWTQEEGNTYKANRSNVAYVLNTANGRNGYGVYNKITQCSSLEECKETPDSWYQSGSTLYIHTNNSAAPDYRYMPVLLLNAFQFNLNSNKWLRLRNFDVYTGNVSSFHNTSSNFENRLILENFNISYAIHLGPVENSRGNGFDIQNIKYVIAKNCKAVGNKRDGFNYHYESMPSSVIAGSYVYEESCESYENGLNDVNGNNNCSTIHEGGNIVRVNGIYQTSRGPVIADVNSSTTFMSHCKVYQGQQGYYAFNFQNTSGQTNGKAVLCDIEADGNQSLDLTGTTGFDVRLKNFKGNYTSSQVTISHYQE